MQPPQVTKKFLIVEDHTVCSIWDEFLDSASVWKTKPKGWYIDNDLTHPVEGGWTVACGMFTMANDTAYSEFGISKPEAYNLPAIFVKNHDGSVESRCKVTAEQACEFINERI